MLPTDPVVADGGYDLSLDLLRQEQQSGFGFSRSDEVKAAKAAATLPQQRHTVRLELGVTAHPC